MKEGRKQRIGSLGSWQNIFCDGEVIGGKLNNGLPDGHGGRRQWKEEITGEKLVNKIYQKGGQFGRSRRESINGWEELAEGEWCLGWLKTNTLGAKVLHGGEEEYHGRGG